MSKTKQKSDSDAPIQPAPPPRLKVLYESKLRDELGKQFGIKNPMALPRLDKIKVSVGMGKHLQGTKIDPKYKEQVLSDLALITGQKPVMVRARKSVSNFKVRTGYEIGATVTVRGNRMWELLDRLVTLAIPRIKDFRGLKDTSFDGHGNYSFGVQEQGIFPEIDMTNAYCTHGMHITIVFNNSTDEISRALLASLGMPFVRKQDAA